MTTAIPTLRAIENRAAMCTCCGRRIARVFVLTNGERVGRACAVRITGWKRPEAGMRLTMLDERSAEMRAAGVTDERIVRDLRVVDYLFREDAGWRSHPWVTGEAAY